MLSQNPLGRINREWIKNSRSKNHEYVRARGTESAGSTVISFHEEMPAEVSHREKRRHFVASSRKARTYRNAPQLAPFIIESEALGAVWGLRTHIYSRALAKGDRLRNIRTNAEPEQIKQSQTPKHG